jgi:hypothetical protein
MAQTIAPLEVDQASISVIMDNSIDLLMASTDEAKRALIRSNDLCRWPNTAFRSLLASSKETKKVRFYLMRASVAGGYCTISTL